MKNVGDEYSMASIAIREMLPCLQSQAETMENLNSLASLYSNNLTYIRN